MAEVRLEKSSIKVRKLTFEYPDDITAHWNPAHPEWSQVVNASSMLMPYLEPFLIDSVREAMPRITDPEILAEAKGYCGQEAQHFKQHARFNQLVRQAGYRAAQANESEMEAAYERMRSWPLGRRLAYAAGFETMALAIGHMLVALREDLFEGADPAVSSLVLWHFAEELEHKRSAYYVYQHVDGHWGRRVYGLLHCMVHSMRLIRRTYITLLRIDGRWGRLRTRWELKKLFGKMLWQVLPFLLESLLPSHDPGVIDDPEWMQDWIRAEAEGRNVARLDTTRIRELPSAAAA